MPDSTDAKALRAKRFLDGFNDGEMVVTKDGADSKQGDAKPGSAPGAPGVPPINVNVHIHHHAPGSPQKP